MYRSFGKRLFDLALALPLLILMSPILLVTAVLIRVDSRGSVLFVQERLGKNEHVFRTYKFRTMFDVPRKTTIEIFESNPEVTRIGFWLRRFKLDELPQLFNVVKGDMSIVGPRPAIVSHLAEYDEVGRRRLEVRPGLTGLAQVNGNIYLTWPERWQHDAAYVRQVSFRLDLWILLKTVGVIFFGEEKFLKRHGEEG